MAKDPSPYKRRKANTGEKPIASVAPVYSFISIALKGGKEWGRIDLPRRGGRLNQVTMQSPL